MKYLQILVCVILISSFVLEIQAKDKNLLKKRFAKKHQSKGILDWLFKDWNEADLTVTNQKKNEFKFHAKIRHVYHDKEFNQPMGIEFDGLNALNVNDPSGFNQNVLAFELIENQGSNKKPILDFRQVSGCDFYDNRKDWFGDWRVEFDVVSHETYDLKTYKQYGGKWHVKMVLPAANKDTALKTIKQLNDQCKIRSTQLNALKSSALAKGNAYQQTYQEFLNRQVSLNDQEKLGRKQEEIYSTVQSQGDAQEAAIASKVSANQQALEQQVTALKNSQAAHKSAQADLKTSTIELNKIKATLSTQESNSEDVQAEIVRTQAALNQAKNLKKQTQEKGQELTKSADEITQAQEDMTTTIQNQQKEMEKLQAEFAAKQAALNEKLAKLGASKEKNSEAQAQNKNTLTTTIDKIATLSTKLNLQKQKQDQIDLNIQNTQKAVQQMQDRIDSQLNVKSQMEMQLELDTEMRTQQEAATAAILKKQQDLMAALQAAEDHQLSLLTLEKSKVEKAKTEAAAAHKKVNDAYLLFNTALDKITQLAQQSRIRTTRALEKVVKGGHTAEINAIVSQDAATLRLARQRLMQRHRAMQRLAKLQGRQAKKVIRLARKAKKTCKGKRCHKKQ